MSIVIFIVMLLVLVVGHEFGHLIVAKLSGMKVPEFGIGFPPKLWGKKIGETEYTINALPFGGFVKIFGEDDTAQGDPRAFGNRPVLTQAGTLFAGPFANFVLAFLLSTAAFMIGVPTAIDSAQKQDVSNPRVLVAEVLKSSPAQMAGIQTGDEIRSIRVAGAEQAIKTPEDILTTIGEARGPINLTILRNKHEISLQMTPKSGVIAEEPNRPAIGIATALVGIRTLPLFEAIATGWRDTLDHAWSILIGIGTLIGSAFTFSAKLSDVAGPIGIVSLVGDATAFGLGSLLSFAALISVNLGVINLLPFPALDGGRLALLGVETLSRRKIPVSVANALNLGGFAVLILLMLAVTAHDILRLLT